MVNKCHVKYSCGNATSPLPRRHLIVNNTVDKDCTFCPGPMCAAVAQRLGGRHYTLEVTQ